MVQLIWKTVFLKKVSIENNITSRCIHKSESRLFFILWQYWDMNLGHCACSLGTLPLEPHPQALWLLVLFWDWVLHLCPGEPGLKFSCLCFPYSWDDRLAPPYSALYWLRSGFANYLPGLALKCDPSGVHHSSSYDCRYEPPCLT
jgi:hypothetical protein